MLLAEKLIKLVVREEGLQHPFQEDKEKALVEALVLEHVEHVEGALPDRVRTHHCPQLVCKIQRETGRFNMFNIAKHIFSDYSFPSFFFFNLFPETVKLFGRCLHFILLLVLMLSNIASTVNMSQRLLRNTTLQNQTNKKPHIPLPPHAVPIQKKKNDAAHCSKEISVTLFFLKTSGDGYHGSRRPSSDDRRHNPTFIPPSALDKPRIMHHYHRWRTTR